MPLRIAASSAILNVGLRGINLVAAANKNHIFFRVQHFLWGYLKSNYFIPRREQLKITMYVLYFLIMI